MKPPFCLYFFTVATMGNDQPFALQKNNVYLFPRKITTTLFATVKRFISITLLIAFLGSTTELHELFKFPHLIFHYFSHGDEQKNMGLVEFIHIHYSPDQNNPQGDDHQDKSSLPFQGEHSHTQLMQFYAHSNFDINLILPTGSLDKILFNHSVPLSEYLANIWQPPKA
ncbi:MAG: hypothetical protein KGZ58_04210 [Ignavibacteriales bacterium]|nr:hypothetical protein [Ignavibacteriales bacterium]